MKNVEENYNPELAPNAFNGLIPMIITRVTGNENTPPMYRTSHAQVIFITPKQWPEIEMRFSDLINSANRMAEDNAKAEKIEIDPDK